ncbi:Holliday junction resolvase RuvX [bacterium]|nr:Holliday junction resolvase RuvX [bacterium]
MSVIVSVDPGREKCGIAVVDSSGNILKRKVVTTSSVIDNLLELTEKYSADKILIGSGTNSKTIKKRIIDSIPNIPIDIVDETHSTEIARKLYFKEYPPKGIFKIIPIGLQIPPVPYDDFAAVVLAKKYLNLSII